MTINYNYCVILVRPQMGENIGAAARVMKNFAIANLRIVAPRDGWPNPKAIDMAKNADDVLSNAQVFSTLDSAIANIDILYATSARNRNMVKDSITAEQLCLELKNSNIKSTKANIGIMFGCERDGLTNDELNFADKIVTIPTDKKYASLNIAQAVAIICYEISCSYTKTFANKPAFKIPDTAKKEDIIKMLKHLESELDKTHFFSTQEKRKLMVQNIRNMFLKANFTDQEVRTMRGIISALGGKE